MKSLKLFAAVVALAGLAATLALAQEGAVKPKREGMRGPGPGPMLEHLLPMRLVSDLKLTADQKAKYDELEAAFKKDAAAWDKAHPNFQEQRRSARQAGDKDGARKLMQERKSLMDSRKSAVDQFRATLTDAQKETFDKHFAGMKERRAERAGRGAKGPPPPPAE